MQMESLLISNMQSLKDCKRLISINDCTIEEISEIFQIAKKADFTSKEKGNIITVFFENSTRTLLSFEVAASNLGLQSIRFDVSSSSISKDETAINTIRTINSLSPKGVILRCKKTGETSLFAKYLSPEISVINAGDGTGEHPTQALLDCFTILENFNIQFQKNCLSGLKIAIAGDIGNSRVARSNVFLLSKLGAKLELISPPNFLSTNFANFYKENYNCKISTEIQGFDADVLMLLRTQKERMEGSGKIVFPSNFAILTEKDLGKAVLMHPGPINEGVEVSEYLAYRSSKSLISKQVENGVKVRSAILKFLL